MRKSERSFQLKKNYLVHFREKMTVVEIAEKYGLNRSYCYTLIKQLAEEIGVDYNSIIYQPHKEREIPTIRKTIALVKPIDGSEFQKQYREAFGFMDKTNNAMKAMLKDWPEVNALEDSEQEEKQ